MSSRAAWPHARVAADLKNARIDCCPQDARIESIDSIQRKMALLAMRINAHNAHNALANSPPFSLIARKSIDQALALALALKRTVWR